MDVAEDYIWEGDAAGREGGRKLLLSGHSMAGFQMRVFQDRNPAIGEALTEGDVNALLRGRNNTHISGPELRRRCERCEPFLLRASEVRE